MKKAEKEERQDQIELHCQHQTTPYDTRRLTRRIAENVRTDNLRARVRSSQSTVLMSVDGSLVMGHDGLGDVLLGIRHLASRGRGEVRVEADGGGRQGGDGGGTG